MKKGTYLYTVLLAFDRLGAALLFNRADITISALAWVVRTYHDVDRSIPMGYPIADRAHTLLRLNRFQYALLVLIADGLELLSPGHCAFARVTDIQTAYSTQDLLDPLPSVLWKPDSRG